jgi:hypothetical protein
MGWILYCFDEKLAGSLDCLKVLRELKKKEDSSESPSFLPRLLELLSAEVVGSDSNAAVLRILKQPAHWEGFLQFVALNGVSVVHADLEVALPLKSVFRDGDYRAYTEFFPGPVPLNFGFARELLRQLPDHEESYLVIEKKPGDFFQVMRVKDRFHLEVKSNGTLREHRMMLTFPRCLHYLEKYLVGWRPGVLHFWFKARLHSI